MSDVSLFADVSHLAEACWGQGSSYCGSDGACCRMDGSPPSSPDYTAADCSSGAVGCADKHCCTPTGSASCYGELPGAHQTYALDWEASGATFLDDFEFVQKDFNYGAAQYVNRSEAGRNEEQRAPSATPTCRARDLEGKGALRTFHSNAPHGLRRWTSFVRPSTPAPSDSPGMRPSSRACRGRS